jgi:hypothetical protein
MALNRVGVASLATPDRVYSASRVFWRCNPGTIANYADDK